MRKMPARWSRRFDAVVNLFTSFGFFAHPAEDALVIREFARVLKPGGILIWHGGSRDGVMARFLSKDWWTTSDGTLIAHERTFDPLSGLLEVHARWRRANRKGERSHRIRLYTATRLAELFSDAGLIVEQAFDGFEDRPLRRTSSEMLLVARKQGTPV
jgi:SAM-dependent methyltransferase